MSLPNCKRFGLQLTEIRSVIMVMSTSCIRDFDFRPIGPNLQHLMETAAYRQVSMKRQY